MTGIIFSAGRRQRSANFSAPAEGRISAIRGKKSNPMTLNSDFFRKAPPENVNVGGSVKTLKIQAKKVHN
jgi:hypothetical protein